MLLRDRERGGEEERETPLSKGKGPPSLKEEELIRIQGHFKETRTQVTDEERNLLGKMDLDL